MCKNISCTLIMEMSITSPPWMLQKYKHNLGNKVKSWGPALNHLRILTNSYGGDHLYFERQVLEIT